MQLWMAGVWWFIDSCITLQWRHNDHDGVSNHQPNGCLLKCLYMRWSKKTSKLRVTGLCEGNSPGPVNSPHKGPVMRKMLPFDDVIICSQNHGPISPMIFSIVIWFRWELWFFRFSFWHRDRTKCCTWHDNSVVMPWDNLLLIYWQKVKLPRTSFQLKLN